MGRKLLGAVAALALAACVGAKAQTVTPLAGTLPPDGIVYGFLLMDGTILFQGGLLQDWYRFVPDQYGSYVNGTFYLAASLPPNYVPYATSGGVLPDGRVLLIGGEYTETSANVLTFDLTNKMAIYDPVKDTWTPVKPPSGGAFAFLGDSPWSLLADGRLLLGSKLNTAAAVFDYRTGTWTQTATDGKNDENAEEGFTLLPDGSVFTVDVKGWPHAERFLPNKDPAFTLWVAAAQTPVRLQTDDQNSEKAIPFDNGKRVYVPAGEIGPAILRPDGSVFATGGDCTAAGTAPSDCIDPTFVGHTAIWRPGPDWGSPGTWKVGPSFPNQEAAGDSYANLLPNGNVLVETNPSNGAHGAEARFHALRAHTIHLKRAAPAGAQVSATPEWHFYEFDGKKLTFEPNATFTGGQASTLLLPTGEVMLNGQATYLSAGTYQAAWAPTISSAPSDVDLGGGYTISGTQFNGLSQANAFGDEEGVATNFPLVRITNTQTGHVFYCRAHHPSTMGVATGSKLVSTHFVVPRNVETGAAMLEVVANGIPSQPVPVMVHARTTASAAP